ncbi:hypothetical protein C8R45DRAFT_1089080 [Mycena sanguinolenta]|nr:hypothetical protein C8R45DRAFT_1089080 [Mycena sanguinolenta]
MQYTVDSEAFDSLWYSMRLNSSQMMASLALYGFYLNLFLLSLYTLSRQRTAGNTLLIGASCTVAVLASTQMALDVAVAAAAARVLQQSVHSESEILLREEHRMMRLAHAQGYMFGINNSSTPLIVFPPFDMNSFLPFQLYRCYVIWGSRKTPLIFPTLLMLANLIAAILGTASKVPVTISFVLSVVTNLVLTVSTAGRILWIQRAASHVALDRTVRGRYRRAVVIILESGAVYCALAIILIISFTSDDKMLLNVSYGMGHQLMNIIPTFTLVYIGLQKITDTNSRAPNTDVPHKARVLSENKMPPSLSRAQVPPWGPAVEFKSNSDSSEDQVTIVIGPY